MLYRDGQEAINNALRHAAPTTIMVSSARMQVTCNSR
jgi:signal transduction histidine kinase